MQHSNDYADASRWFHMLVHMDPEDQHAKLQQLRRENQSVAQFVSELLQADDAVGRDHFLEMSDCDTRELADSDFETFSASQDWPVAFGPLKIVGEIGKGGMGIVYRAHDESTNRYVALKLIRSGSFSTQEQIDRFRREAKAASQMEHPNIVRVYTVGTENGTDYFTMEWIDGMDLNSGLSSSPLESKEAARIIEKVALAAEFAHTKGIIHRDIKPRNILLAPNGEPKLLDFGLAKSPETAGNGTETRSNQLLGTLNYMAPEQIDNARNAGPRTDVYGLGATLYFCLTGQPPITGNDLVSVLKRLRETMPVGPRTLRPDIHPDLELICLRCLQKDPVDRYESAEHLSQDLRRYLEGKPVEKAPMSWWHSLSRQISRDELLSEMPSSKAAIWIAILTLLFHSTVFLIAAFDVSNIALWIAIASWFAATNLVNYVFHWSQYWQIAPIERQSGIIQLAVNISLICLFLLHGPLTFAEKSSEFLQIYPPFTMILAVAFVAHGEVFGRLLLPAFLFFPLAVLMAYVDPLLGPLLLGIVGSGISAWSAQRLLTAKH